MLRLGGEMRAIARRLDLRRLVVARKHEGLRVDGMQEGLRAVDREEGAAARDEHVRQHARELRLRRPERRDLLARRAVGAVQQLVDEQIPPVEVGLAFHDLPVAACQHAHVRRVRRPRPPAALLQLAARDGVIKRDDGVAFGHVDALLNDARRDE